MIDATKVPQAVVSDVIALRRDLHMHPELGFQEYRTASVIASRLGSLGYDVYEGIARTGVVGVMRGDSTGRTIMLRADMDALPMVEETTHDYRSVDEGKMHACGHDAHVAILLGAAAMIADARDHLHGTVCLVFQPAEEALGGAKIMLGEGLIERFGIERAYALHITSRYPTGMLGFREGPFYASSDTIEIEVFGKGGHASTPHDTIDPIYTAAEFVSAVQQVVSRNIDPLEPAVVTISSIHGGTIHNVIPPKVRMLGTLRAFSESVRNAMPQHVERILAANCQATGATYEFTYLPRYPVTVNDPDQASYTRTLARRTLGEEHVFTPNRLMAAEDFAFFAHRVPACFFMLGARGGPESSYLHHSNTFDIDEAALPFGVAIMTALALDAPRNAP